MTADQGFELHPGAASDIAGIWEFIAEDNPHAAGRVREDILDAIRRLVPFPRQATNGRISLHDRFVFGRCATTSSPMHRMKGPS
jgi:plasmid stabilization system protein ParE